MPRADKRSRSMIMSYRLFEVNFTTLLTLQSGSISVTIEKPSWFSFLDLVFHDHVTVEVTSVTKLLKIKEFDEPVFHRIRTVCFSVLESTVYF